MGEMSQGLIRLGLDPAVSDGANLKGLWQLYKEKEEELTRMEEKQKKEMQAVEKYIENIRKVSEERDALTEDLEAENEALKGEVRQLRNELNGRKQGIKEALKEGGMHKLSEGPPNEAVAFLLTERTRLINELNQAKKLNRSNSSDKSQGQESPVKSVLEKAVQDSKDKEKKIRSLDGEVKKLKFALLMEKRRKTVDLAKSGEGDSSRASSRSESKIPLPMKQAQEKGSTDRKVKELTDTLAAERKTKSTHEATIIKLKALLNKKETSSLQQEEKELERDSLEKRLIQFRSESEFARSKEGALFTQDELGLTGTSPESTAHLHREFKQLQRASEAGTVQLDAKMVSLEEEKKKCSKLEGRLRETENKWEGVVSRYKSNEEELKSKLSVLSREVEQGKAVETSSQREIVRLKAAQGKMTDTSKSEAEQLTLQLIREQNQVRDLRRRLGESEHLGGQVEDLRKDRDALAKELETVITRDQKNQVTTATVEVLENENKTLKDQLNENLKRQSDLIQDLNKIQKRNSDLSADLNDAKESTRSSEGTIKFLREELSRKSKELTDTFDFTREGQSKMEFEVVNLQQILDDERKSQSHENGDLKVRLEVEEHKNQELNRALQEKAEEISTLRREVSRLSLNSTRFEERNQEEEKHRRNVDSRNKVLEEELDKLWSQLKDVMEKHAANEMSKTELEGELYRLTNEMRDQHHNRSGQQAEQLAAVKALERAQQRAQAAERKIPDLQEELDTTLLKLETVQTHSSDLAASRKEIQGLKEDLIKLKIELQEEKVHSSLLAKQLKDLQGQLKVTQEQERHLDQVNSDLKHQLLTVQSELSTVEGKQKNTEDMHFVSEQGKQSLQETASSLQMEVHRLQVELTQTANQLENQSKKYLNLKLQTKEKMENAREIFSRQKATLVDKIEQVQAEMSDVNRELEKERHDRDETKSKNQTFLTENRQLMEKMAEHEESLNDKSRNISSLEYRTKFLEQENGMLQDRISTLSRQRTALEKVVREYRLEKQKEDIYRAIGGSPSNGGPLTPSPNRGVGLLRAPYSSGLGNSLSNSLLSGMDGGRPDVNGLLVRSQPEVSSSPRVGAGSDGMIDDREE